MPEPERSRRKTSPKEEKEEARRRARHSIAYLLTSLFFIWLFQVLVLNHLVNRTTEITYSDFKKKLADHKIVDVTISDTSIQGTMKNQNPGASPETVPFNTVVSRTSDPKLLEDLQNANV